MVAWLIDKRGELVKRIGLVVKAANPQAVKMASDAAGWLAERGGTVYVSAALGEAVKTAAVVPAERLADDIDVMLVLGGDGTMLLAARLIDGRRIPIVGVNLGGLGFLTAIRTADMYQLLDRVMKGEAEAEERMMLDVTLMRGGRWAGSHRVLNDAVVKGASARLVRMETKINNEYITTYRADGLIVATPTGSTAYSLSAAGPILYPTIHSIIVVPICPFNLTNRPVVIPDWMSVEVKIGPGETGVNLVLDGQVDERLEAGDAIEIKRSEASVWLVRREGESYFDILRERLMWELTPDRR